MSARGPARLRPRRALAARPTSSSSPFSRESFSANSNAIHQFLSVIESAFPEERRVNKMKFHNFMINFQLICLHDKVLLLHKLSMFRKILIGIRDLIQLDFVT